MQLFTKLFKQEGHKGLLDRVILEITSVRKRSEILAIAPATTGYNWMGVSRATTALFPNCTIHLPQYYSSSLFTEKELNLLIAHINKEKFSKIIFSGFPEYFGRMINQSTEKVYVIYHGFFSELAGNSAQQKQFNSLIKLVKENKIRGLAFNKKGMAETVGQLWKLNTSKIIIPTPILSEQKKTQGNIHIGVFGNNQFRKNLINQVVAGSLINASNVHLVTDEFNSFLPSCCQLTIHSPGVAHSTFLELLGSMHINLHLSYSESWGQLTTESLSMGVPCLVAYHSDVFDYNEELKQLFVVEDYDNPWAIKEKIEKILTLGDLSKLCKQYVAKLNMLSEESVNNFLEL